MSKVLRTTLALAVLLAAVANAPGLLRARGGDPGSAKPADAVTGSVTTPVDYRAFDCDCPALDEPDPGLWIDALFNDTDTQISSWRHTWTDFESTPTTDALAPYRLLPLWGAEGVLLAYAPTFSDEGPVDDGFDRTMAAGYFITLLGARGGGGSVKPQDQSMQEEEGPTDNGPDDELPDYDPPPPSVADPIEPDPVPPVSVPEPASMSLLALGLAGILMLGKRRRIYGLVPSRGGRGRG